MTLEEITKNEFDLFARKHPLKNFLQTSEMSEISDLRNWKSFFVGIKKANKLIGACRIMGKKTRFNKYYFYAPRGPLLDYSNNEEVTFFTKEIKKFLKRKNGYVLDIDPAVTHLERDIDGNVVKDGLNNKEVIDFLKILGYKHEGFINYYNYSKQVRWVFMLNINNKSEAEIFKNMRQNHRNIINKTDKFCIEIKELDYDELKEYKKITEDTSERRNFDDKPLEYYQKMYEVFGNKKEVKYLIAYLNVEKYLETLKNDYQKENQKYEKLVDIKTGKAKEMKVTIDSLLKRIEEAEKLLEQGKFIPLSAAMFLLYEDEITYLFSGSYQQYKNFYAQYAIQWYMIKYGIRNNFKTYNFYGITGNFDKKDLEYGVYEFKKGFGGKVIEYIGSFELPLSLYYYVNKIIKK